MGRKNASLLDNVLMELGLVVMVVGVGYSILSQLPQFNMSQYLTHGAVLSTFVGAILWLTGARVGGHEQVCDRYWQACHYGKCCHRSDDRRHNQQMMQFADQSVCVDQSISCL